MGKSTNISSSKLEGRTLAKAYLNQIRAVSLIRGLAMDDSKSEQHSSIKMGGNGFIISNITLDNYINIYYATTVDFRGVRH